MIKVEFGNLKKNIKKLSLDLKSALEEAVSDYVTEFVTTLSDKTPLGDVDTHLKLYQLRNRLEGFRIQEGLARGNWRVTFRDGATSVINNYETTPGEAGARAFDRIQEYTLGRPIYIINNAPYIGRLNEGYSKQAPAKYIEAVTSSFLNWGRYSERVKAIIGG